jgi:hypothetical protein
MRYAVGGLFCSGLLNAAGMLYRSVSFRWVPRLQFGAKALIF